MLVSPQIVSTQSLLRYPGGKYRGIAGINKYLPDSLTELCSPFFGGGNLEISLAGHGVRVHGSDAFRPVVDFWQAALNQPALVADRVYKHYPMDKDYFRRLQKSFRKMPCAIDRAAAYFAINRASFSGSTLSGGMAPLHDRFNRSSIEGLRNFRIENLSVECLDYRDAMDRHPDLFLYLDPPYANGEKLYGDNGDLHSGFDHEELARLLRRRKGWLLSYNDSKQIRDLYKGFEMVRLKWNYGMPKNKEGSEVLILNL